MGVKMKNPDLSVTKAEIQNRMVEAIRNNDTEAFSAAFNEFTDMLQEAVMAEARGLVQAEDNRILMGRGVRTLTSEERKFYQQVIDAMKSDTPKQALAGINTVLPETVIDAVFEDLTEDHPLLGAIDFRNTAALVKVLYSTSDGRHLAKWGKLTDEITKELAAEFKLLDFGQVKLSAFVPIHKPMLDLGPEWLDRYVRVILAEAIANGLEDGIVNGRGVAEEGEIFEPIGMVRDLTSFNTSTGYGKKTATAIEDFSPEKYLSLIAELVKTTSGRYRRVTEVLLVVNPIDYLTKIAPATMYRRPDGTYIADVFPFPTRVVQSAYVTQGEAVLGIARRYLMALGTGPGGRIEYSDDYRFLEDERIYLIKLYGNGRPLDNTSFLLLDVSSVKPIIPTFKVVEDTGNGNGGNGEGEGEGEGEEV